ncbi:MAG: hypothetical protein HUJ28_03955 [Chromatiales bacterium]|nr:hypothetical protein [Chromatiales bacterium]
MTDTSTQDARTLSAKSCRGAAKLFNYGNIVALTMAGTPLVFGLGATGYGTIFATVLAIVPIVLWFGGSMLLYALNRHHPNPRVGHYTQWAAYRFYALVGALIVVGTFFPPEIIYFLVYWAISASIIIPWSIWDIIRINRETWEDTLIPENPHG